LAPDVDAEPVRQWRAERDAKIAEQDRASAAKHEEIIKKAHKDIDQFYEEYNQKKAKLIARNRYAF
jgi:hypothetical protein